MKRFIFHSIAIILFSSATMQAADSDTRWGDLGDGSFANPVLNGDYSDPDVIRVGDKYYMTCSEFHFMGMNILESDDMVNWKIIGRVYDRLDFPGYDSMEKYGGGTWAPALRYHDGKFWIFVCTPGEGLLMTTATDPAGPWTPLHLVKSVSGWEDPCPFWDEDGNAYIGRSQLGAGPIYLHKMEPDGKRIIDEGVKIYEGPVAEGTKFYKKDGYYYLSIPEGGVGTGWQTVLRSKSIYGPYEGKRVLETGSTDINGPHQGALVDTPDGEWWFYHFQSTEPQGRVVHLQPVEWVDGFPVIGCDYDGNGIGEPMKVCRKPATGVTVAPFGPQASDDFESPQLGLQWQFNHNPDNSRWSLTDNPGRLTVRPMRAKNLRSSRNQFTQKTMGYKGTVTVKLDYSKMVAGDRAGIECIGNRHIGFGVIITKSGDTLRPSLYLENDGGNPRYFGFDRDKAAGAVWLRLDIDAAGNVHQFSSSVDGENFIAKGDAFQSGSGDWKGSRIGLFGYNTEGEGGEVIFDDFGYDYDGPGCLKQTPGGVGSPTKGKNSFSLSMTHDSITVAAPADLPVNLFAIDGRLVCGGFTNNPIARPVRGLYIVSVADSAEKIAL